MKAKRALVVVATTVASLTVAVGRADAVVPPAGAQVFSPPSSIAADCSADVTRPLYDWINSLPEGTATQPTEVQFASGGCYQVDGMIFLRGLTDFIFDGNGSTFRQSSVVDNELKGDPPPNRPAYCGFPNRFVDASTSVPSDFDIMWFVEGGCDLVFQNMDITGTNTKGRPGGARQQDSAIQINGAQRVLVTSNTISDVWGDFVTVSGLHEARYGGLSFPSFDVTVSDNTCTDSGRQGISIVYADRLAATGNTLRHVAATAIDIEAETGGGLEGDILVADNSIHGYLYLLAAITYSQLFDLDFTGNTFGPMKIVVSAQSKFPGHDFTISGNRAGQTTNWPNAFDNLVSNEVNGLISANTTPLANPTPDFVHADATSGIVAIQGNTLNPGFGARRSFLPDPLTAQSSVVATECGNTTAAGKPLDGRANPSDLAQCVTVSPHPPAAAQLPAYLAGTSAAARPAVSGTRELTGSTAASGEPGTVDCSGVTGTVTFNPPLADGGTSTEVALAQVALTGCTGSAAGGSPQSGYGTVTLVTPANDCSSLESGGGVVPANLVVSWSPTTLGTSVIGFPGFALASNAGAGLTMGGPGTSVTGSYAGGDAGASTTATGSSSTSPADIAAACGSADGLQSLTIDGGSLSVG